MNPRTPERPNARTFFVAASAAALLSACALFQAERPVVTVDYGAAALAYADGKAAYTLLARAVAEACTAGKLGPQACAEAGRVHERVQLAETFLRDGLRDPRRPVDWEKVTQLLGAIAVMALHLVP